MNYPVQEIIPILKDSLRYNPVVILQAPPGAGKSTIVPLELLNEPWLAGKKKIIMLEPRRLATRSVAMRMASLLEEEVGNRAGYRIRFESKTSDVTRIEVVTEGILTRMIQRDNALEDAGLIIFDEFHERSLQADLSLALCLQLQQLLRNDLRILLMSATLDAERISSRLSHAPIVTSTGKQFPVEITFQPADSEIQISTQVAKAIQKAMREHEGDILAFLPGAGEIIRTVDWLEEAGVPALIYPLYGDLSFKKQQDAILPNPQGKRKVVLATSIAETSLTIEGIRIVVDSGYSRVHKFDPRSGLTRLETVRVTKDAADQRTGRAGRLGPGVCYRLWSEAVQRNLTVQRTPEILEADLAPLVLELCAWGIHQVGELTWLTHPPEGAVNQAYELLQQLEAIDDERKITPRGKAMVQLPTHPRIAHMLMASAEVPSKLGLATDVAALLEERDPLARTSGADLCLRITSLRNWRSGERVVGDLTVLDRVERLASAWRKQFNIARDNSPVNDYDVGEMIALAYPERIARQSSKNSERYKLANGRPVKLPDHDNLMREPWLAVAHLDSGTREGKIFLAAPLEEDSLHHLGTDHEVIRWNAGKNAIEGLVEKRVGNLVLEAKPLKVIPDDRRIGVLTELVRAEGLKALGWSDAQREWQARVMSLKRWRPEERWPDVTEERLLLTLEGWLSPYLSRVGKRSELERLDLNAILGSLLPWDLHRRLDERVPPRIEVPSGSKIQVKYFTDGSQPIMEVRLQEVFGMLETPTVNEGKTRIIMHLLSPGFRPVQVTQDLKNFWQTTYHEVRKELRRRYPKHDWPENPLTAKAVRGVRKKY
jgi:ATP-dependent helicase HrpB